MSPSLGSWRPRRFRRRAQSDVGREQNQMHSIWGDTSITAPTDAGFGRRSPSTLSDSSTLDGVSPINSPELRGNERNGITITIPLPWSRRASRKPAFVRRPQTSDEPSQQLAERKTQSPSPEDSHIPTFAVSPDLQQSCDYGSGLRLPHQVKHHYPPQPQRMFHASPDLSPALVVLGPLLSPVVESFAPARSLAELRGSPMPSARRSSKSTLPSAVSTPLLEMVSVSPSQNAILGTSIADDHISRKTTPPADQPDRIDRTAASSRSSVRSAGSRVGSAGAGYGHSPSADPSYRRHATDLPLRNYSGNHGRRRAASADPSHRRPISNEPRSRRHLGHKRGSSSGSSDLAGSDDDTDLDAALDMALNSRLAGLKELSNGRPRKGTKGFYANVVEDYKLIAKDVDNEAINRRQVPLFEAKISSPNVKIMGSPESLMGPEMVPSGEELWG